jgi:hypothetical protein
MKEKFSEKWFKDVFTGGGVSQNSLATITDREGKTQRTIELWCWPKSLEPKQMLVSKLSWTCEARPPCHCCSMNPYLGGALQGRVEEED